MPRKKKTEIAPVEADYKSIFKGKVKTIEFYSNRQVFRVHDERTIPAEMAGMVVYESKGRMIVPAGCEKRSVR